MHEATNNHGRLAVDGRRCGRDVIARWARFEPDLAGLYSVEEIVAAARSPHIRRADRAFAALLRLASTRGHGDGDALLLLIDLMEPGLRALAADLADLAPDVYRVAVSELALHILEYGPGPRGGLPSHALPTTLLRGVRHGLLEQFRPGLHRGQERASEVVRDPRLMPSVPTTVPLPGDQRPRDAAEECTALLAWARRRGLVSHEDAVLVVVGEASRDRTVTSAGQARVAAACGIHPSTLRRRRNRTIATLRSARSAYLRDEAIA